jgi:hypothetical protein
MRPHLPRNSLNSTRDITLAQFVLVRPVPSPICNGASDSMDTVELT